MKSFVRAKKWCSDTTWGSARWQRWLVATIAALIFWPQSSIDPDIGSDPSWEAGLALARVDHLSWGRDVIFNEGPLGFLQNAPYYSASQTQLGTVYQPLLVAVLFLGIVAALRQRFAPMKSLLCALVITGVVSILGLRYGLLQGLEYPELAVIAAFAWSAVPLLERCPTRPKVFTICLLLAVAAGFQLLVKFNIGLAIVLIALTVSLLLDWRHLARHVATVAAFAASILLWWVLAGQRPGNLPAWLKYSAALVSGYSEAMARPLNLYTVAAAVWTISWLAVLGVIIMRGGPQVPRRLIVLAALVTVISARAAIGRAGGHLYVLIGLIVTELTVIPLSKTPRRWAGVTVALLTALGLSWESAQLHVYGDHRHDAVLEAVQAPRQSLDRLLTVTVPTRLESRIKNAKARQRALYAVPDLFLGTIGSATVHLDPEETSAVWAYDFAWRPAPVFQAYQANTPTLDGLNSDTLAEASGPRFVLSRLSPATPATGIDGRLGVQESPRYSRAILCNYAVNGIAGRWALFAHTGPRCGPLTPLSQVTIRGNEAVTVPAPSGPGKAVLVGVDLQRTILDRMFQGSLAPLAIPTVVLDGLSYRLVAANAVEPFLVSSPASVEGTNLQIHAHTIGVGRAPTSLDFGDVTARLRFYEVRVEP
jgi:hypothetical protein